MYKKQKANNSFFTGDSNVLDLTSRNVVARTLQNVVQEEQQQPVVSGDAATSSSQVTNERKWKEWCVGGVERMWEENIGGSIVVYHVLQIAMHCNVLRYVLRRVDISVTLWVCARKKAISCGVILASLVTCWHEKAHKLIILAYFVYEMPWWCLAESCTACRKPAARKRWKWWGSDNILLKPAGNYPSWCE